MATHHDGRAVSGYQNRKLLPKWRRASIKKERDGGEVAQSLEILASLSCG